MNINIHFKNEKQEFEKIIAECYVDLLIVKIEELNCSTQLKLRIYERVLLKYLNFVP